MAGVAPHQSVERRHEYRRSADLLPFRELPKLRALFCCYHGRIAPSCKSVYGRPWMIQRQFDGLQSTPKLLLPEEQSRFDDASGTASLPSQIVSKTELRLYCCIDLRFIALSVTCQHFATDEPHRGSIHNQMVRGQLQ